MKKIQKIFFALFLLICLPQAAHAASIFCDADRDGYEKVGRDFRGRACAATDCNDSNSSVHPGATETCDGVDTNCSGDESDAIDQTTWYQDSDSDTYGDASVATIACEQPTNYVADNSDCNDSSSAINPGETETCNSIDDDCNGTIDDGLVVSTSYRDSDSDGYGETAASITDCQIPSGYVLASGDCDDVAASTNPGATELCNGIDDNCDGTADNGITFLDYFLDADGDGYGDTSSTSIYSCTAIAGYVTNHEDCDDTQSSTNPGQAELCNGIDDNCDGNTDETLTFTDYYRDSDNDGYGDISDMVHDCEAPSDYVTDATDCDDTNDAIHPLATELCNGINDDCDGAIDDDVEFEDYYLDADGDGYGDPASTSISSCDDISGYVANSSDCDDTNGNIFPLAAETCNNIDDNCDGTTDNGLVFEDYYADLDGDGYGDPNSTAVSSCLAIIGSVTNANDCDDTQSSVNPGMAEQCNDLDDDCDGATDEDITLITYYTDADNDGFGDESSFTSSCNTVSGAVTVSGDCDDSASSIYPNADEVIDDGIDQDCNGIDSTTVIENPVVDDPTTPIDDDSNVGGDTPTNNPDDSQNSGTSGGSSGCGCQMENSTVPNFTMTMMTIVIFLVFVFLRLRKKVR